MHMFLLGISYSNSSNVSNVLSMRMGGPGP